MKTAGIMTWYIGYNIGAVLQAYALNRKVSELDGWNAVEIQYQNEASAEDSNSSYAAIMKQALHGKGIKSFFQRLYMVPICKLKRNKIDHFRNEKMKQTKYMIGKGNLNVIGNAFDAYICGSDQIWNPGWLDTSYMLDFVADDKNKISYAASVGSQTWPEAMVEYTGKLLDRFSHISLREVSSVPLIKKLCNCTDVVSVCDPVFLLDAEEWIKLAEECSKEVKEVIGTKYIFCYLFHKDDEKISLIEERAKKTNVKIVNLAFPAGGYNKLDLTFGDIRLTAITPQDFIALILHAQTVFTDSFHCVCFSLIENIDFFCFTRKDFAGMNLRILDLAEEIGVKERIVSTEEGNNIFGRLPQLDYLTINGKISSYRTESYNWLINALLGNS